jgi:hypothetical protein
MLRRCTGIPTYRVAQQETSSLRCGQARRLIQFLHSPLAIQPGITAGRIRLWWRVSCQMPAAAARRVGENRNAACSAGIFGRRDIANILRGKISPALAAARTEGKSLETHARSQV